MQPLFLHGPRIRQINSISVMNNALIPTGPLVNLLIWYRDAHVARLALDGAIIVAAVPIDRWRHEKDKGQSYG